jgi:serine/threonine-protein kinase SRPK3
MEHQSLFKGKTMEGEYDPGVHLAEMIAILGPAPPEFLKRTENSLRYWDEEGMSRT